MLKEDRHVKIPDLTKAGKALKMRIDHLAQPSGLFAVYDGHQGHLCAEYVAKHFHLRLLARLSAERDPAHWAADDRVRQCLRGTFEELDVEFLAKHRTAPDGCTAVVALLLGRRLFVAWLGDSRCLLCRATAAGGLVAAALTEDHRPGAAAEAERVRRAGGKVVNFDGALRVAHEGFEERIREIRRARAQGLGTIAKEPVALAVSRAFGDRDFKAETGKALLSATPSVRCVELNESCRFLALVCDGVPDVMRNEEAVAQLAVSRDPADVEANARAACGALVQEAYRRGSRDNLTVVYVGLDWGSGGPVAKRALGEAAGDKAKRRRVDGGAAAAGSG